MEEKKRTRGEKYCGRPQFAASEKYVTASSAVNVQFSSLKNVFVHMSDRFVFVFFLSLHSSEKSAWTWETKDRTLERDRPLLFTCSNSIGLSGWLLLFIRSLSTKKTSFIHVLFVWLVTTLLTVWCWVEKWLQPSKRSEATVWPNIWIRVCYNWIWYHRKRKCSFLIGWHIKHTSRRPFRHISEG